MKLGLKGRAMQIVLARHGYRYKRALNLYERADGFRAEIESFTGNVLAHDGDPDPVSAGDIRFIDAAKLDKHLTKIHKTTKQAVSPAVDTPRKGKETTMGTNAKAEVAKLVKKLKAMKNKSDAEGRKIRRILRKLGHWGGLGTKGADHSPAKKAKPAKKAPAKATAKRAARVQTPTVPTPAANPDQAE